MNSEPSSRPLTPILDESGDDSTMLRLSFRKGGDKALYAVLKRSLLGKAWQVHAYALRYTNITLTLERLRRKRLDSGLPHRAWNALGLVRTYLRFLRFSYPCADSGRYQMALCVG